jgi:hypothetical protein
MEQGAGERCGLCSNRAAQAGAKIGMRRCPRVFLELGKYYLARRPLTTDAATMFFMIDNQYFFTKSMQRRDYDWQLPISTS